MDEKKAYLQILRASSIIGGASVINIFLGLLRLKVAALLMGPAGIGLVGILQNLMTTGSVIASMGIAHVGTRQIAEADSNGDAMQLAAARRALVSITAALALAGAAVFWLMRDFLASRIVGDSSYAMQLSLLAIGVALMVGSASQNALFNGLRHLNYIARVSIFSALLSTFLGVAVLLLWGKPGVFLFVLCIPVCSFLVGYWYVSKLPRNNMCNVPHSLIVGQWHSLLRLGSVFAIASLVANLSQLAVRSLLQQSLGEVALGNFQAAAQISMTYLGFILGAMGTDYYPRLTSVIRDNLKANQMINQQTEVAILLGGVMLLGMMTCAPWVIQVLYSEGFNDAPKILRWHILGDLFKILSWPLGFILLAAGDARKFFVTEMVVYGTFILLVWAGVPGWGIQVSGIAFLLMYVTYLPLVYYLGWRKTGLKWSSRILREATMLFALLVLIFCLSELAELYSFIVGVLATCLWGAYAYRQLHSMNVLQRSFLRKK